jgi:hypothetical protein
VCSYSTPVTTRSAKVPHILCEQDIERVSVPCGPPPPPVPAMGSIVDQCSNDVLFEDVQLRHMRSGLVTEHIFWVAKS